MLNPNGDSNVQKLSSGASKAIAAHNRVGDAYYAALENWARVQSDPTKVEAADLAVVSAFEEMWRVDMRDVSVLADVPPEAWPDHESSFVPDVHEDLITPEETHQPDWVIIPRGEVRKNELATKKLGSLVVSKLARIMKILHLKK